MHRPLAIDRSCFMVMEFGFFIMLYHVVLPMSVAAISSELWQDNTVLSVPISFVFRWSLFIPLKVLKVAFSEIIYRKVLHFSDFVVSLR